MATAAHLPANGDRTQPELWVGNLPKGTKSKALKDELASCGIDILRCQVKKPKSRHPYAFVRVRTQDDARTAIAAAQSLHVGGRTLKVKKSNRCPNNLITDVSQLEIHSLHAFSIGVFFLQEQSFFQRWSSTEIAGLEKDVKCTMDFEKGNMHLCFMTCEHEYKIEFFFRDMEFFLYFGSNNRVQESDSYGLLLAFRNAPLVYRRDREDGAAASVEIARQQVLEYSDEESLYWLDPFNFDDDDDDDDDDDWDFLWVDGDIETERDWRRTTSTFTVDAGVQGQYFHYLLTPQSENDFKTVVRRLRNLYEGWEHYMECPVVKKKESLELLELSAYNKLAQQQPFQTMFLVETLVAGGLLYRELLSELFFDMLRAPNAYRALRHYQQVFCPDSGTNGVVMEDPVKNLCTAFDLIISNEDCGKTPDQDFKVDCSTGDHVMIYGATITPLVIYCNGPHLETPNRVLRKYKHLSNHFLRIQFVDEHFEKLKVGSVKNPLTEIMEFIKSTLSNGIDVAGRHYEFLAMSNSQLRECSCWLFAPEERPGGVITRDIHTWMGDFSAITNVAKYAARMGQCFSCTTTSGRLAMSEDEFVGDVPDIETQDGQHTFSDGIGMISQEFAKEAALSVPNWRGPVPSAFQIRFAGYKGMVAVHPGINPPMKMMLRKSMRKFASQHHQLEIIQPARLNAGHLNRQIILLLSSLGVPDGVFERLQRKMTKELDNCIQDEKVAMKVLGREHCLSEAIAPTTMLHTILSSGFKYDHPDQPVVRPEPFLEAMMLAYRNCRLSQLEEKAHIYVEEAACLQGVLDESTFLDYGEVHIRIRDSTTGSVNVITGPVAVAKNPCLHPGDIRVLMAMEAPDDKHSLTLLENCLVFPSRGPRPHPDECSGSDLDGDTYFVTWNHSLIPPKIVDPANYVGKEPQRAPDKAVEMDEVFEFFVKYMQNDSLGKICNAHMALADLSPDGALDPVCIELAQLQSHAVDFPKTGVPAKMEERHYPPSFPDFMKKRDKTQHISQKVLGRLFREIHQYKPGKLAASTRLLIDNHRRYCDSDLLIPGHQQFCESALACKDDYDLSLENIMQRYGLHKEEEAVGGFFIKVPRVRRRAKLHDLQAKVREETTRLRRQYLDEEFDAIPEDFKGNEQQFRWQKASAWYSVTYNPKYRREPGQQHAYGGRRRTREELISFPWIAFQYLCEIKRSSRRSHHRARQ